MSIHYSCECNLRRPQVCNCEHAHCTTAGLCRGKRKWMLCRADRWQRRQSQAGFWRRRLAHRRRRNRRKGTAASRRCRTKGSWKEGKLGGRSWGESCGKIQLARNSVDLIFKSSCRKTSVTERSRFLRFNKLLVTTICEGEAVGRLTWAVRARLIQVSVALV